LNSDAFRKLAHTTQYCYRHIVNDYLVPHWGNRRGDQELGCGAVAADT
jgi:hypothetical protein